MPYLYAFIINVKTADAEVFGLPFRVYARNSLMPGRYLVSVEMTTEKDLL